MQTKGQRFAQWRGKKAQAESYLINTVFLIRDYMESAKHIDTIKTDFSNPTSPKYEALNQYSGRFMGVLLYCKLTVDEFLDQLPVADSPTKQLLRELNNLLSTIYEAPQSKTANNINNVIIKTKQMLSSENTLLEDKKKAKELCFAFALALTITYVTLNKLNFAARLAISALIDLEGIKKEIVLLLEKVEVKVKQLEKPADKPTAAKNIQDYFNEQFLKQLNSEAAEEKKVLLLAVKMRWIIKILNQLHRLRIKKEELSSAITSIQSLLNAAEDNDKKITKRLYFVDLIDTHKESFATLMKNIDSLKEILLEDKIVKLRTPNVSSKVLHGLSKASSWATAVYRYMAPEALQNISSQIILTLDAECKAELKVLAQGSLNRLNLKLGEVDKQISQFTDELSEGNIELKELIEHASSENLVLLGQVNQSALDVMDEYQRIGKTLTSTSMHLNTLRRGIEGLNQFILSYDGIWVRFSNFLAQICSIFKSETAEMIDNARLLKRQLEHFELDYKKELTTELDALAANTKINPVIKIRLQQRIELETSKEVRPFPKPVPEKGEVRYLMAEMHTLFKVKGVVADLEPGSMIGSYVNTSFG